MSLLNVVVKWSTFGAYLTATVLASAQTRVPRTSSLTGQVIDAASNPVAASIIIYRRNIVDGSRALAAISSSHTDADGSYRCERLPAGVYIVAATPDRKSGTAVTESKNIQKSAAPLYGRTFYPSTTDMASAELIKLPAGQQGAANIVIHPSQRASFHGKISGTVLPHSIRVLSHSIGGDLPVDAAISFDEVRGEVVIGDIPAGSFTITANANNGGRNQSLMATAVAVPGRDQTIAFAPVGLHHLHGTVQIEANCSECKPVQLELRRIDGESTWNVTAVIGPDGSFAFPAAADGDYVVSLPASTSTYIEGVMIDGKPSTDDVIHCRGDVDAGTLLLQVARTDAAVSGKLDAGDVVAGKSGVVLEDVKTGAVAIAKADSSAQFEFDGLGPGQYRVYAWRDLSEAEYRNRGYLQALQDQAVTVSVDDSKARVTDIKPRLIQ